MILPTGHPFKINDGNRRPGPKSSNTEGESQDNRKQGGEKRDAEQGGREKKGTDTPTM